MADIKESNDGLFLPVRLSPRASKDSLGGWCDGRVKIFVTSPPVDNKANAHLIKFISKLLKIPRMDIAIATGEKSRNKTLFIKGLKAKDIDGMLK
jgi:uncharacterized protein